MRGLLDTHLVLWIVQGSTSLEKAPWLDRYKPWGLSPVSLLEMQYLREVGRLPIDKDFFDTLTGDPRFLLDEVPTVPLFRHALGVSWTREPFDRLLAAHSLARRVPLCTVDRTIREHHTLVAGDG